MSRCGCSAAICGGARGPVRCPCECHRAPRQPETTACPHGSLTHCETCTPLPLIADAKPARSLAECREWLASVDRGRELFSSHPTPYHRKTHNHAKRLLALVDEQSRTIDLMRRYMRHDVACPCAGGADDDRCDCGLAALLREIAHRDTKPANVPEQLDDRDRAMLAMGFTPAEEPVPCPGCEDHVKLAEWMYDPEKQHETIEDLPAPRDHTCVEWKLYRADFKGALVELPGMAADVGVEFRIVREAHHVDVYIRRRKLDAGEGGGRE